MNSSRPRPTIIDIARIAGVSKSTVSRVLSDAPNISEKARQKVMAAVEQAGYERNQMAQSLRSGRTGMLGLVIPDIANPFWAEVARGAQDRAAENGSSILIFSSDWNAAREASHLRALLQARVDGVIVNPVEDRAGGLERVGMPMVLIGSSAGRFPELSSVGSDVNQAVELGLDHLRSLGHGKPVLLVGSGERLARARFLRAVHDYFYIHDIDPGTLTVLQGDYTVESGRHALGEYLAEGGGRPPFCLFAANDLMALGALRAVRESGLKCPEDVSILGFDGIASGAFSDPGLSTIEKPARDIGVRAVELLQDSIAGSVAHRRMVLPCRLKLRGSLAAVPGAAHAGRKAERLEI